MSGDLILVAGLILACGLVCGLVAHIVCMINERRRDSRTEAGQDGVFVSLMAKDAGWAYEAEIRRMERLAGHGKRRAK